MYTIRNEEEKRIWNDALQLRRAYTHADLRNNAHGVCAFVVDTLRFQSTHNDHPMAALLAEAMSDEITSRWAAANQPGSGC